MQRVAVLGCGAIARQAHLEALRRNPRSTIVALAEPEPAARSLAAKIAGGAVVFDSFEHALSATAPDAVVIALPTLMHHDAAVASFERGAHVYLEKPLAESLDRSRAVHGAWTESGRIGRIGFNGRYNPLCIELKRSLALGDVGAPIAIRTVFTSRSPAPGSWRANIGTGGGALLDLASHHVDMLRFLLDDEVRSVNATLWSERESAMLLLTMRGGVHAQLLASYGTIEQDRVEVFGSGGSLAISRYDSLVVERGPVMPAGGIPKSLRRTAAEAFATPYGIRKLRSPGADPSFADSIDNFLAAIESGSVATPDMDDGLRAAEVVEAARISSTERRSIELE